MTPVEIMPVVIIIGYDENINVVAVNQLTKQLINALKEQSAKLAGRGFAFSILLPTNGGKWSTGEKVIVDDDFCLSEEEGIQRREKIIQYKTTKRKPLELDWGSIEVLEEENIFIWQDLDISNECNLADLFGIMKEGFSSKKIFSYHFGLSRPHLILFYCGSPSYNYKNALEQLRKNVWYEASGRMAVALSVDTDREVLREFTENPEAIFDADDPELLSKIIKISTTVECKHCGSKRDAGAKVSYSSDACPYCGQILVKEEEPT
jgi:DNA-directed RNA polymerase subunit RPC12/RpoP